MFPRTDKSKNINDINSNQEKYRCNHHAMILHFLLIFATTDRILESKLKEKLWIENINLDILKTLNLYNKAGYYNIAGRLLADKNNFAS